VVGATRGAGTGHGMPNIGPIEIFILLLLIAVPLIVVLSIRSRSRR
jgi:hypothetical protein